MVKYLNRVAFQTNVTRQHVSATGVTYPSRRKRKDRKEDDPTTFTPDGGHTFTAHFLRSVSFVRLEKHLKIIKVACSVEGKGVLDEKYTKITSSQTTYSYTVVAFVVTKCTPRHANCGQA